MAVPTPHRSARAALLSAVLLGLALAPAAGAAAPEPATSPAGAAQRAVVVLAPSLEGRVPSVAGVRVVSSLPGVGSALVEGDATALRRLAGTPGVRGLSPDVPVAPASAGAPVSGGVLSWEGLGGRAGTAGAGAGVRVAVVDTGVSDTEGLSRASGRLVDGVDTSQLSEGGEPLTGGPFPDGHGHGTFMASVVAGGPVAATGRRPLGVAPGATVVNVKVADAAGTTSLYELLGGLDWVAGHLDQVDVVNLSFSHERPTDAYGADPLVTAVQTVRGLGVPVVVSAGNEADRVADPGFTPQALTVGAADLSRRGVARGRTEVAAFSGSDVVHGYAKPDVVASGVRVLGAVPAGSVVAQQHPGAQVAPGVWRGTGTSQATAVVSGLAALVLQSSPHATPAQVKATLRVAAQDLAGARDGAGLVRTSTRLVSDADGQALDGSGDLTGEASLDASSWSASSWSASSWSASSWSASSWSRASSWSASSWSGASSWSASSWSASSWSRASSWSASSWSASSWSTRWDER